VFWRASMTKYIEPGAHSPRDSSEEIGSYSSPPCYLHEFDAGAKSWEEVRAWRKLTRDVLIANRLALSVGVRRAKAKTAKQRLRASCDLGQFEVLGIYWPMRGEIDVRDLARAHIDAGGVIGLPVVVEKSAPVEFWRWSPGMRMRPDTCKISTPAEREVLQPDALIVPLVGFDVTRYRLGYGGGYYDRTIASAAKRPFCIGLGYAESELDTIYPQSHDIPMDVIVTDA
jgi:5-formyltetrahydrofolate cyclo-ligase